MTVLRPVHFEADLATALAYLADPWRRPEWQSSLRRVEDVRGAVGRGQTWTDVTVAGVRPRMETTVYDLAATRARWSERGEWKAYAAELTLDLTAAGDGGCDVVATFTITGPGAFALNRLAPPAVRADLRRAARRASR